MAEHHGTMEVHIIDETTPVTGLLLMVLAN